MNPKKRLVGGVLQTPPIRPISTPSPMRLQAAYVGDLEKPTATTKERWSYELFWVVGP
jgi:hypothetical protein